MNREAELLDQITDLKARLIVAERDLAEAKNTLETERHAQREMLNDPDRMLRILGLPLGDVKEIYGIINEWNRLGGRPAWIEEAKEKQRLRERIAELEEGAA